MPRFTAAPGAFGPYTTVRLNDLKTGASAEIALRGATLLSLTLPVEDSLVNVIGGYQSPTEFDTLTGARSAILAPFSNRIESGQYRFNDKNYRLPKRDKNDNAIHGFVTDCEWRISHLSADDTQANVVLTTDEINAQQHPEYPFNIHLEATFRLTAECLSLTLEAQNVGNSDAPFGCGWHPYLLPPSGNIDDCLVSLPHRCAIAVDSRLIPLPGEQAYVSLSDETDDFCTKAKVIGPQNIDQCYTGPATGEWLRSWLYDPVADVRLEIQQERGVVHIYTSHSLPTRQREGLAVEPNEFIPNAFNRPELVEDVRLEAGQQRVFRCRIAAGKGVNRGR
ncbi:aldose 1-epimerase [Marinobacter sp. V034]|uniref:aldose 1-epimerase n=1 Tax=Marinobacter sp. V034 TaxID=3459610 RepID=UPI00404475E9